MAKFCSRCGAPLDTSSSLCPSCDREKLEALNNPPRKLNFCTQCGTPLDDQTGTCPNCTKAQAPTVEEAPAEVPVLDGAAEAVLNEPVAAVAVEAPPAEEAYVAEQISPAPVVYKKKGSGVGKVLITIMLSIILFVTTLLSVAIICVRHTTSENTILSMMEDIDYADLLNGIYTEPNDDPEADYGDESWTFVDYLSDYFDQNFDTTISDKQVDSFVQESTIKEFMAETIAAYMSDIYNGTDDFEISKSEVRTLLRKNRSVINREFDVDISNESLDELADWLVDDEVLEDISAAIIKEEVPAAYYALNIGLSYFTLVILLLMVALCLVGLCFNSLSQAGIGAGVVFTVIGGTYTVFTLIAVGLPVILKSVFGGSVIGILLGNVLVANLGIFAVLFLLGVAILVVRAIVRKVVVKRRARQAA